MSLKPYREESSSGGRPDDDLARLAAQGERRASDAKAKATLAQQERARRRSDEFVRGALSAYDGWPMWCLPHVLFVAAVLGGVASAMTMSVWVIAASWVAFILALVLRFIGQPPLATDARVEAEQAWIASLPFSLTGYFEALAVTTDLECRLVIEVRWCSEPCARSRHHTRAFRSARHGNASRSIRPRTGDDPQRNAEAGQGRQRHALGADAQPRRLRSQAREHGAASDSPPSSHHRVSLRRDPWGIGTKPAWAEQ